MAPRVMIFGTGAIGATYAYILSRSLPLKNIVTVCRSNYEPAKKSGFKLNSAIWGQNLVFHPTIVRSVNEAVALDTSTPFDYVLVCSKILKSQTPASKQIAPAVTDSTAVVLMQNGIAIEEEYAQAFPRNPILSSVIYLPVTQTAPTVMEHTKLELLHVGTYPAKAPTEHKAAAKAFVELFRQGSATIELHDDVQPARWKKLLINGTLNPICALSRLRTIRFFDSGDDAPALFKDAMLEIMSVAQALGYTDVDKDAVEKEFGRHTGYSWPGVEPSTMADALAGRNMEVDALVGNVVRLAKQHNIAVPILRTMYLLLQGLSESFQEQKKPRS